MEQDIGLLELGVHLVGIGDEVGRQVAAVELHAFDDFELRVEALCFLDRDHALVADLLHGVGDHLADRRLAVGRYGADLGDLFRALDLLRALLEVFHDDADRQVDAAPEVHRVHARGDRLGAFPDDGLA